MNSQATARLAAEVPVRGIEAFAGPVAPDLRKVPSDGPGNSIFELQTSGIRPDLSLIRGVKKATVRVYAASCSVVSVQPVPKGGYLG